MQLIDEFTILKKEKDPLLIEYLDYLSIIVDQKTRIDRFMGKCIIQDIDQIQLETLQKPDNEINYTNSIEILGNEKPENVVEERDAIDIPAIEKAPNQVEYIDELFLEEKAKPENEIQIVDQMDILEEERPEN